MVALVRTRIEDEEPLLRNALDKLPTYKRVCAAVHDSCLFQYGIAACIVGNVGTLMAEHYGMSDELEVPIGYYLCY